MVVTVEKRIKLGLVSCGIEGLAALSLREKD